MDAQKLAIQNRMYQYSRAIYRSIKDLIDPHVSRDTQLEYRRAVLAACEDTMERLERDPLYFSKPERSLFQDIRRYDSPRPSPYALPRKDCSLHSPRCRLLFRRIQRDALVDLTPSGNLFAVLSKIRPKINLRSVVAPCG